MRRFLLPFVALVTPIAPARSQAVVNQPRTFIELACLSDWCDVRALLEWLSSGRALRFG